MNVNVLIRLFARIKGLSGAEVPLQDWKFSNAAELSADLMLRWLRGWLVRIRIGQAGSCLLCDRGVRLRHPSGIRCGKWFSLEEGCEIVGLARRGVVFGERCTVGRGAIIRPTNVMLAEAGEGLRMGDHSNIGPLSFVGCSGFVEIGSYVMMGPRVNLLAETHVFEDAARHIKAQGIRRSFIRVEDNCWIGASVTILPGVTIGRGSVIGAGAVVADDIPPDSVAVGSPARVIRSRGSS